MIKIKKHHVYKYHGLDPHYDNKKFLFYKKNRDSFYNGLERIIVWNAVCLDDKRNEIYHFLTLDNHLDKNEWKDVDLIFNIGDIVYYKKTLFFDISKHLTANNERLNSSYKINNQFALFNGYSYRKDSVMAKLMVCDLDGRIASSCYIIPIQHIEKRM